MQRDAVLAWTGGCAQFIDAHLKAADERLIAPAVEDDGLDFQPQIEIPMFRKKL